MQNFRFSVATALAVLEFLLLGTKVHAAVTAKVCNQSTTGT